MTAGSIQKIGDYHVLASLGQGGQGHVYRVQDPNITTKQWALKVTTSEQLYRQEGAILRALAEVKHPGVPFLGNAFESGGQWALLMTYFQGDTLEGLVGARPGWRAVWSWIVALADVLGAVHRAGYLHLDLKPENVIKTRSGQLRLVDFANGLPISPVRSSHGQGTPGFAAPEQMRQGQPLTPATDMFGLGALTHYLIEGRSYTPGTAVTLGGAPPALGTLLTRMLAEQPGMRPSLADIQAFDPVAAATTGLVRCPSCQRENRHVARFCAHCGKRVQASARLFASKSDLPPILPPTRFEAQGPETQRVLASLTGEGGPERRDLNLQRLRLLGEDIAQIRGFDHLIAPQRVRHLITSYDHQVKAVERALREMRGNAILADEVGLGKTIEAGLIIKELVLRKLVGRVLILVPHHLPDQWADEMREKLDMKFVSYEGPQDWGQPLLVASIAAFTHPANPHRVSRMKPYDLIVVDEMHNLLLPTGEPAEGWKLLNTLQRKYLLLLSATPVRRHLKELYHLVSLVKPGHFDSEIQFLRRFQATSNGLQVRNSDELRSALQEVMIRNSRQTIAANLLPPPRQVSVEEVIPTSAERELLERTVDLVSQGRITLSKALLESMFSSTSALVRVAQERSGLYPPAMIAALGSVVDSKVDRALELIAQADDRVIVFTRNRDTADAMARAARAQGRAVIEYRPGLTRLERVQRFYEFKRAAKSVLVTMEGAAEGRNLQFCQHLINLDIPWNPLRLEQRIGRIDRIGQRRTPMIYNLIMPGTFEQDIHTLFHDQLQMFALIVGELATILADVPSLGNRTLDDMFVQIYRNASSDHARLVAMQSLGHKLQQARLNYAEDKEKKDDISELF